jgi:hypothetical protein
MTRTETPRFQVARSSIAALAAACALAPAPASAISQRPADGTLSPRLAQLSKSTVRSAPRALQAEKLGTAPDGPGSLLRRGNRVLVEVRFDHGAAAGVAALRAAGAEVVNVSPSYQTATVAVSPADLPALAAVARVDGVSEVLTPIVSGSPCPSGYAVSEGDNQLSTAEARKVFGVDGSGVTIGILSDSFDTATTTADHSGPVATHAIQDIFRADLPGVGNPCGFGVPVNVLSDFKEEAAIDEGRAMAQVVHDLAPGSRLAFATAFDGETAFAESVEQLARPLSEGGAGAKVIVDDISYFAEPFFQDGPVAVAVNRVTSKGVSYFSAAGNDNLVEEEREIGVTKDIASWEAPQFRDAGSCPAGVPLYAVHCLDFDPGTGVDNGFAITVEPEATVTVDVQWAQPWNGVATDLDAYLISSSGGEPVATPKPGGEVHNVSPGRQRPVEVISWTNPEPTSQTVQLAIDRCDLKCDGADGGDTGTPRVKFTLLQNGGGVTSTEYSESFGGDVVGPTIFGHSGAEAAVTVGAVRYDSDAEPEKYSSRGPVEHYFGPVTGSEPAQPLDPPQTIAKPDVTATDCGVTSFFAFWDGVASWRFCGTSASAPHAAAVAALMRAAAPLLTPTETVQAIAETAQPIGGFGPDAVGAGLVDSVEALEEVAEPSGGGSGGGGEESPEEEEGGGGGGPNDSGGSNPDGESQEPLVDIGDRTAPGTYLRARPPRVVRRAHRRQKLAFRFGSDEGGVSFICRVDRGPARICLRRFVRRFAVGRHVLRVRARDAAGNVDPSPVVVRFVVE